MIKLLMLACTMVLCMAQTIPDVLDHLNDSDEQKDQQQEEEQKNVNSDQPHIKLDNNSLMTQVSMQKTRWTRLPSSISVCRKGKKCIRYIKRYIRRNSRTRSFTFLKYCKGSRCLSQSYITRRLKKRISFRIVRRKSRRSTSRNRRLSKSRRSISRRRRRRRYSRLRQIRRRKQLKRQARRRQSRLRQIRRRRRQAKQGRQRQLKNRRGGKKISRRQIARALPRRVIFTVRYRNRIIRTYFYRRGSGRQLKYCSKYRQLKCKTLRNKQLRRQIYLFRKRLQRQQKQRLSKARRSRAIKRQPYSYYPSQLRQCKRIKKVVKGRTYYRVKCFIFKRKANQYCNKAQCLKGNELKNILQRRYVIYIRKIFSYYISRVKICNKKTKSCTTFIRKVTQNKVSKRITNIKYCAAKKCLSISSIRPYLQNSQIKSLRSTLVKNKKVLQGQQSQNKVLLKRYRRNSKVISNLSKQLSKQLVKNSALKPVNPRQVKVLLATPENKQNDNQQQQNFNQDN